MSHFTDLLAMAKAELTHIDHMAMQLLHAVANGHASLDELNADHPLLAAAIQEGTVLATAAGIPLVRIEDTVIAAAKAMETVLTQPAQGT